MGPKRKKSKPNTQALVEQEPSASAQASKDAGSVQDTATKPQIDTSASNQANSTSPNGTPSKPSPSNRNSWISTGSWRAKASPVAQVARESISVAGGATSEALAEGSKQIQSSRPGQYVSKSMRGSRKSIPLAAEPTKVHATSESSNKSKEKLVEGAEKPSTTEEAVRDVKIEEPDPPLPPVPTADGAGDGKDAQKPAAGGAWFGWWSRPDGYGSDGEKSKEADRKQKQAAEDAVRTPLPGTPAEEAGNELAAKQTKDTPAGIGAGPDLTSDAAVKQGDALQPEMSVNNASSKGWFGLWSSAQNEQVEPAKEPEQQQQAPEITVSADGEPEIADNAPKDAAAAKVTPDARGSDEEQPKSSGWAFWSTDKVKDAAPTPGGTQKQVGELAVADTPSQSHPEAAQFNAQPEAKPSEDKLKVPSRTASLLKRGRKEKSRDSSGESSTFTLTPNDSPVPATTPVETPTRDQSEAPAPVQRGKQPQTRSNLILPSFRETYPPAPSLGYIERLTQYLASSLRIPGAQPPPPPQHVFISPTPPKIKKAIAIGVHGYFPAPLIQKVLGQPTGTSIRFANFAAASIKSWCLEHQPDVKDIEIEKVALEGEGYIADRVTTLWKLLLNWLSHLRQADFILVACHSQGVPVAITLVSKLIQLGCLSPGTRVGICAMAGVSLGPFPEYKSKLFGGSAAELFEFGNSSSRVSKDYASALDVCLRQGVRITYTGSLDDQLVSLESSLNIPLSHPYVNRATFIDGRIHAPNFLTHLVVFALRLRNLGLSDHGLIRELSGPLAGSLYGGDGHSRVYDDPAVYALAVDFALESTDMPPPSAPAAPAQTSQEASLARRSSVGGIPHSTTAANQIRRGSATNLPGIPPVFASYEPPPTGSNVNPFYLPWAVRGMLGEDVVKRDMGDEVEALVREFEEWRPSSKVLKDVRWRLEGVKSML